MTDELTAVSKEARGVFLRCPNGEYDWASFAAGYEAASARTAAGDAGPMDGRQEIVASLIRDAIEIGTDEAADWNAKRVLAYLFPEASHDG